jgi:hypothetical protein
VLATQRKLGTKEPSQNGHVKDLGNFGRPLAPDPVSLQQNSIRCDPTHYRRTASVAVVRGPCLISSHHLPASGDTSTKS